MYKNDKVLFFNELCLVLRQRNIFFELKSRQRNIWRKEKRIAFAVRFVAIFCSGSVVPSASCPSAITIRFFLLLSFFMPISSVGH